MVLLRALGLALVLLHLSGTLEAKLHYAVVFPSEMRCHSSEQACVHLSGAEGDSRIQVTLNMAERNSTVIERNLRQKSLFSCVTFQVPPPSEGNEEVATMEILIESAGETITNSSKVLVKRRRTSTFIQTDKAVYKPGQTVRFRVVSLKENLQPGENQISVIQLQDPNKNRIAQWLDVTLTQGIAELSLPLSPEPSLGEYSIHVGDTVHYFSVEEYVLPKFEVSFQFPKVVFFTSEQFQLKTCGRYTYGKPVQGTYKATVCRKVIRYWWGHNDDRSDLCVDFSGKLDQSGCSTLTATSENFNLTYNTHEMGLEGTSTITEGGTGVEYSGSGKTIISSVVTSCSFLDADSNYKPGIPYSGTVKVVDANDDPIPNQIVYLTSHSNEVNKTLVSDENGLASFQLENTAEWKGQLSLRASTTTQDAGFDFLQGRLITPNDVSASLMLKPFHSPSKSFLKLHSQQGALPCEGQRDVRVEYIIPNSALGIEVKHMELHYLVASKGSVKDSGSVEVPITSEGGGSSELRGEVSIKLTLSADVSPTLRALAFISLPNGELVADSATFKLQRCFKNKVSVGFSPDEVLPGADVSLQVQAAAGSLCGLRVVDQSVVLMKPDKELTADQIHNLFPFPDFGGYDARVQDSDDHCPFYPWFHRPMWKRSIVLPPWHMPHEDEVDVYSLFKDMRLKIVTSAEIKKPLRCREPEFALQYNVLAHPRIADAGDGLVRAMPKAVGVGNELTEPAAEIIRAYFPETWIWQLEPVGESGRAEVHGSAPDTITEWNAGAFCMGPSGFGISPPTSLRAFQPFFVELTLPYSVVRGESFTLKASVFNYLKQCIKVQTTLQPSLELEQEPCADCQYSSCICADESKTFYWNLKASNLGEVNITVRTEALNTQDMCNNEIPIVPKQGHSDTVIKPLLVQPGGVLIEKSHSSLICSPEGEDHSKTEDISLNVPENILEGSERAYVTALGDLMGTAMQNLDRLLAMPYGCGEQNMVLFAPNIFILQYLENTHQLSPEIQTKAKGFLESGYQRQLTYKRNDGSYSAFGSRDPEGNTWLTAFVVKSFSKARPYIFIDGDHLNHSFSWLKDKRQRSGCFRSVGKLFNNAMKGGVDDEISLSAYVTIALMEAGLSKEDPMVSDALSCLRKAARKVSSAYTQALLAYTFTLSDDTKHREKLLAKLEEKAVRKDGQLHWERKPASKASDLPYWYRAPSAEVELTSYALLALLSGPNKDLGKASEIVNWLSKQQNPYGGFSSTQDTVVALQALAEYAEATFSDKGDVTVTVTSKTGFHQQFHVDQTNRLLLQKASLPDIPGEYSLSATGSGCVYVQTVLRYNIPPPRSDATFSVRVETQPQQCPQEPMKQMGIDIYIQYTGSREKSNMALVEVKMLSGFTPDKKSIDQVIRWNNFIMWSETQTDKVTFYLSELGRHPVNFSFMVEQEVLVKNLRPAIVKVYDYYEPGHHMPLAYGSSPSLSRRLFLNKE
ncbi:alpha-2-macroglobulin-like 1 isoform X3 [Xenopus tropicalis]|uniref:Alpha-2-macroglobulin-like 1 isoform X3 n=1 Tax=Xenopus tropicalis TaxID=8364 RepID=A0A8J1JUC3_XENTR|nr:alpha-2-macroglobulin-like 1 isoform X3 [Xenopus tropicalis]